MIYKLQLHISSDKLTIVALVPKVTNGYNECKYS